MTIQRRPFNYEQLDGMLQSVKVVQLKEFNAFMLSQTIGKYCSHICPRSSGEQITSWQAKPYVQWPNLVTFIFLNFTQWSIAGTFHHSKYT